MSSAGGIFVPRRLWSLWDIMRVTAEKYLRLGRDIEGARVSFTLYEQDKENITTESNQERIIELRICLNDLTNSCAELNLTAAQELVQHAAGDLPQTTREFEFLIRAVTAEIKKTTFLFIPEHLAVYHDLILQDAITVAFPMASKELIEAGNCLAAGLYTASVFHAMRGAEIGLRILGNELGVSFPDKPIELAEWQNILDNCDSKIVAMKEMRRGTEKTEALTFYSQAAVQFRYFKDAYRVRAAHAHETFNERKAMKIFDHTLDFFEAISTRLKEPKAAV